MTRETIHVRQSKNGKARAVPMNVTGRAALEEQQRMAEHVFVSPRTGGPHVDIKRAFTAALRKAGIEDFRFHDLRHTAATRLADTGADAFTIAEILGHSSLAMTKRYTHATDEAKRRAVERLAEKASSCLNFASKQIRQAG